MTRRNIEAIYPLSPLQQGMLFHTLFAPGSGEYVVQSSCCLTGSLNIGALDQAWQALVSRHTILRTCFIWERQGEPLQVILDRVEVSIEQRDWRGRSEVEQKQLLESYLQADKVRGFELDEAPLMRMALMWTGEE